MKCFVDEDTSPLKKKKKKLYYTEVLLEQFPYLRCMQIQYWYNQIQ